MANVHYAKKIIEEIVQDGIYFIKLLDDLPNALPHDTEKIKIYFKSATHYLEKKKELDAAKEEKEEFEIMINEKIEYNFDNETSMFLDKINDITQKVLCSRHVFV